MIEYGMQLKGDFPREIPGEIPRETPNHNLIRIGNNIHGSHTHTHTSRRIDYSCVVDYHKGCNMADYMELRQATKITIYTKINNTILKMNTNS